MDLINQLTFIIVSITSLVLGFGVFYSDRKSTVNRTFFWTAISLFCWITFGFIGLNYALPLQFLRLNFAAVSLFLVAFYNFTEYFPVESHGRKFLKYSIIITGWIFAAISIFSSQIIRDVAVTESEKLYQMGNLAYPFYLFVVILTGFSIYNIIKKYRTLDSNNKTKITFLLIGIILFAIFNVIFNVVFPLFIPNGKNFYQFGDYSAIFLIALTGYSIIKHQLFNIKVIATESIVILLSIALFIEVFISNQSIGEGGLKAVIWILATYGGWQLIKSVKNEIKQKEDLERLAKKLEQANEHLKEIDKLKDDFLSMASHELNTPIAAIEGYLSMILQEGLGGKIPPKARQYLDSVFQSSQRLAHLVKDLLNVSRIESNRIHIIYEEKAIEDVIDQAVMEVMSKAREARHTLTFVKPKKALPRTWFDVTRITEVLINMLGNSIKYTPDGGKITVHAISDDKKIVVSVEDNGKGIPKDRAKVVFEKFSQVDVMKDEVKGTGLGMYIAKKFIELMHGQIWFHSDGAGKGTTFYFSLPILKTKPFDPHEGEGDVLH